MSNDLGIDRSGNGNNWTVNNITNADQVVDSPTNNFATLNPLQRFVTNTQAPTEGNLKTICGSTNTANKHCIASTMGVTSGKWYFEVMIGTTANSHFSNIGVGNSNVKEFTELMSTTANSNNVPWDGSYGWGYDAYNGNKEHSNTQTSYGSQATLGDIISVAIDMDNSKIWFGSNGTWIASGNPATGANAAYTNVTGNIVPVVSTQDGATAFVTMNFGQDSSFAGTKTAQGNQDGNDIGDFYYTPPTGYLALCTKNLPDVAVVPSEHFNTVLYTGNNSSQSITGVGFQPDFGWWKRRNTTADHSLIDSVRGVTKHLVSNTTGAEQTASAGTELVSFDTDGFTLGATNITNSLNGSGDSIVAWNWKANGSGSSNTDGSINATVSANTDAGFSIINWTKEGSSGTKTVGHGLSKAPEIIIFKEVDDPSNWSVWNSVTGYPTKSVLYLDLHVAEANNDANQWSNTAPTSTVFTYNQSYSFGGNNTAEMIGYAFHSVDGYSKVGSYKGNASNATEGLDGTFVYTGFRPAWVMCKLTTLAGESWLIKDNKRSPFNPADEWLYADKNSAEATASTALRDIDFLSNGFKFKGHSTELNGDGHTYIYIAFAETPFKYSNAR